MMYQCECGTILRNILPYQLIKHRLSKKHLNCLITRHMELDLRKQKKNKTIEPTSKAVMEHIAEPIVKPIVEPTAENNDPLEITFD